LIFLEKSMVREVDVAIIGAGSAGLFALSQVRKKTDNFVLIDGGELGTTCARVGCMPSKVMVQVAEDFQRRKLFEREGIDGADELSLDAAAALEHVQDLRDMFVDRTLHVTDELDEAHLIDGYAKFVDVHTLEVNGEQIRAGNIIIATGSTPVVPEAWVDFAEHVLTTDTIFELEELPASLAVIGLGAIGLELGQALNRLGVEVTAVDQLTRVAGLQDEAVNQQVIDIVGKEFSLWLGEPAQLCAQDGKVEVRCGEQSVVVEKVLASLGRKPNLESLDLEKTGAVLDASGIPEYNPLTMQLGDLPIFIAGDVNADRPVLHEAGHEGRVAGYNAVHQPVVAFKRKTCLGITFCEPNIAIVGAQLNELDEQSIAIGEIQFGPVGRALIIGKNRGVLRIYAQRSDGRLLGAAMVCVKGENLAHLIAWAIQQELTVFDMLKLPFYHPVIEEALQAALYDVLPQLDIKQELVELERV
jgi:dihydrolipoamide dehydrogenase